MPGKGGIKMVSGECCFVFLSVLGLLVQSIMLSGFGEGGDGGVFSFSFLTREYIGNKTKWAVINDFILVFDPGLFFTSMLSLTELVGTPVSSNLSEIYYLSGSFHWEVSQTQEKFSQKKMVLETYSTT